MDLSKRPVLGMYCSTFDTMLSMPPRDALATVVSETGKYNHLRLAPGTRHEEASGS